jgi:O-antigen/teichoic acid export membrane protein
MSNTKPLELSFLNRAKNFTTHAIHVVRSTLNSKTGRDTQLVFVGQVISAAFGFFLNVILLRRLSVDDYGRFSLFSSILMLLSGFMHWGWVETFVRFGAKYQRDSIYGSLRRFALHRTILISLVFMAATFIAAPWIASTTYHREEFSTFIRMAAFGAFLTCLFSFVQNEHRAKQEFSPYFVSQVGAYVLRFFACGAILLLGYFTLQNVIYIYIITPLFFLFPIVTEWLKRPATPHAPVQPELLKEMVTYNHWIMASSLTTHLIGNIDSHIVAHFHGNTILGSYGAVSRLTLPIHFMITALTVPLLPRLSAAKTDAEVTNYLHRLKFFLVPLVFFTLTACWWAPPLLVKIAGQKYSTIGTLVQLQIITMLVAFLTNPIGLILYAWGFSKWFAVLNFVQLIVDLVLDLLWIPRWGAYGAISATLVVNLLGFVFVNVSVWHGLRKRRGHKTVST